MHKAMMRFAGQNPDEIALKLAHIAWEAGRVLRGMENAFLDKRIKDDGTPTTAADLAAEELIIKRLDETWPGVPLLIDSPAYKTTLAGSTVEVHVPLDKLGALKGASFDGLTAGLRVNANLHAPLLCVAHVFKVASGNLSLPGKVAPAR